MREGILKRRASMSKTTRGKNKVNTRLGDLGRLSKSDAMECKDVVKMTSLEGQRCGVNGGQE